MSYGKRIFRGKYKETMDSLNIIKDNYYELDQEYQLEIGRLHSIIKEVREYISKSSLGCDLDESETFFIKNDLLEILDKVGDIK